MLKKLKSILRTLGLYNDPPLTDVQHLVDFIDTRAAYVSQITLYTYVKARAGTQYPKLFENADFLTSLKIARWHIYGAAVCDLTLFSAAQMHASGALSRDDSRSFAIDILDRILKDYSQDDIPADKFQAMGDRGKARAAVAEWEMIATGPAAFQSSADAVFRWAPIADALKTDDEEIVRNSIHLRWIGVRRDTKDLIRPMLIKDSYVAR